MGAMINHSSNAEIQKIGAAVLADLSLNVDNEQFILRSGGLRLVMVAMKKHPKNLQLQETLCSVLADLTRKFAQSECIIKEQAVELLITALSNFPTSEHIQRYGIATLRNLACVGVNCRQEIIDMGGTKYIM